MYSYSGLKNLKEICSFLCIKSVIKKKLMQLIGRQQYHK